MDDVQGIKILSEGQVGRGLLVESDAGIITHDLNRELIKEDMELKIQGSTIFINCILQKAGVLNRNGRIYPRQILERELKKYSEKIDGGNALGQINHPDCCDKDSWILTKEGWKPFTNISDDEEILTLNPQTKKIEVQQITKKIDEHYNGLMYHFHNRNLDKMVTPNHRFLLEDRYGKEKVFITAEEIFNNRTKYAKYKILKDGDWDGITDEYITIPKLPNEINTLAKRKGNKNDEYSQDLILKTEDFFAFMGIYLAEGFCKGTVSKKFDINHHVVIITQKKEETKILINELIESLGINYNVHERGNGTVDFKIYDARLYYYLWKLGSSTEKYIPVELKQYDSYFLNILFQWFLLGDGRKIKTNKNNYTVNAFSTSRKLIEDLHEVLLKSGGSGNIRTEDRKFDRLIEGRLIKGENSNDMHFLCASFTKHIFLNEVSTKIEKINYNDKIYCVNVPNGTFMVMRNGKTCWTGNSLTIELGQTPHRLVKYWWEGDTAMGKLEIFLTKGYIQMGICSTVGDQIAELLRHKVKIGISSRGLGSVKKIRGANLVQDDFELVCFDLVESPSTPNAYLFQDTTSLNESHTTVINLTLEHKLKNFIQM